MFDVFTSVLSFCKRHFFFFVVIFLCTILVSTSYIRFVLHHNYLVSYEGECNPYTESCFEDCEDENCNEMYYYSIIEREASEVYKLCGPDVSLCDEAFVCQPEVKTCSITFCDPETEGDNICVHFNDETL